jgi:hypothetical protein
VRVDERAERIEEAARRLVALDPVTCASWALGAGFNELRGALDD